MTAGRFCVLVNSSDRARDIFEIVFRDAERMWAGCDWPRFAGFTSAQPDLYGFRSVATRGPSDWRGELADQLDALPPEIEYVLRVEDDALLFSPVDGRRLNAIADLMVSGDLACVRLLPVSRGLAGRGIEFFRRRLHKSPLRPVSFDEPYYSSLASAIWKRSYLREVLKRPGTVWDFEFIVTNERHYAVWEPVLDHAVIVTKGAMAQKRGPAFGAPRPKPRRFETGNTAAPFMATGPSGEFQLPNVRVPRFPHPPAPEPSAHDSQGSDT